MMQVVVIGVIIVFCPVDMVRVSCADEYQNRMNVADNH